MYAFVIFPHGPWSTFPFKDIAARCGEHSQVYYVAAESADSSKYPDFLTPIHLNRISELAKKSWIALVTHPFWVHMISRYKPYCTIALLPEASPYQGEHLWRKCWDFLAAEADLLGLQSETAYLEQCFRRERVILLRGEEDTMIWDRAVQALLHFPEKIDALVHQQWDRRKNIFLYIHEQIGSHEMMDLMLAVYLYLLHEDEAASFAMQAYEQAVKGSKLERQRTHFRFLSAVLTQHGDLDAAISTYAITALNEEEKQHAAQLQAWHEQDEDELVRALLFQLNDDHRSALRILSRHSSEEARRLMLHSLLMTSQLDKALSLLHAEELQTSSDLRDYMLLEGSVHELHSRYQSIHPFLQALDLNNNALTFAAEQLELDQQCLQLLED